MKRGAKDGKTGKSKIQDRSGIGPLALRPQALSIYWEWGCGEENANMGPATVVSIEGPLEAKSFLYDGYDAIIGRFRDALKDETTSTVVLRIDSPGGECAGCFDAVEKMRALAAKSNKRIVAVADEHAYSAAYALACVADEIYLSRSAGVGSIGVIAVLADCVALNERIGLNVVVVTAGDRKADGHPDVPLSEEAIAGAQSDVETLAGLFYDLVSSARGVSTSAIQALQAATFMGADALDAGLADGVMTFDEVIAMIAADDSTPVVDTATSNERGSAMKKNGKKVKATAKELGATDAFSHPQVAAPTPDALNAIARVLGGTATAAPLAAKDDEETESETVTTETVEKDGTTTTTTESTETTVTPGADDDGDGDGGSDDDEEEEDDNGGGDDGKEKAEVLPAKPMAAAAKATSGDVLAYVREITGAATPAAQLGSLHALAEKAASAEKSKKQAAAAREATKKQKHAAKVDSAIRAGKLAPAKKAWALAQSTETLDGYLATSEGAPIVRTQPTPQGTAPKRAPAGDFESAIATVAAACHVDVKAVTEHADDLRAKGLLIH